MKQKTESKGNGLLLALSIVVGFYVLYLIDDFGDQIVFKNGHFVHQEGCKNEFSNSYSNKYCSD
jgi:hypothetical protein